MFPEFFPHFDQLRKKSTYADSSVNYNFFMFCLGSTQEALKYNNPNPVNS